MVTSEEDEALKLVCGALIQVLSSLCPVKGLGLREGGQVARGPIAG